MTQMVQMVCPVPHPRLCFIHHCGIQNNTKLFCIPFDLQIEDASRNIEVMERIVEMQIIRNSDMQRNLDMQT